MIKTVHLLRERHGGDYIARCGKRLGLGDHTAQIQSQVTGWWRNVTCPACQKHMRKTMHLAVDSTGRIVDGVHKPTRPDNR